MSAPYPASTISVKCIGTTPLTCVATKVEETGTITEADLKGEGTTARVGIVTAVRKMLASKAPASVTPYIRLITGVSKTITRNIGAKIELNELVEASEPVTWTRADDSSVIISGVIHTYDGTPIVVTGTVGKGTDIASVEITINTPPDEEAPPTITIKDDVVGKINNTTAIITRDRNVKIDFNELVTTNSTAGPIAWKIGMIPLPGGIIPKYIGEEQVFTGTVGTAGTGAASVTITVKPPEEAAKPATFTIKIKDAKVYRKDDKNYIDKKSTEQLDLNTLVVVEPAAGITWGAGFLTAPPNGILNNTTEGTEITYTGTVNGAPIGNSKAVIAITVKTVKTADGGRRKKGSTQRRRVGRILRKTGTRAKR